MTQQIGNNDTNDEKTNLFYTINQSSSDTRLRIKNKNKNQEPNLEPNNILQTEELKTHKIY